MKGVYFIFFLNSHNFFLFDFTSLELHNKKSNRPSFFPRGGHSCKKFLSGVAWESSWESDAKATLLSASYDRHFTFYCTDQRMWYSVKRWIYMWEWVWTEMWPSEWVCAERIGLLAARENGHTPSTREIPKLTAKGSPVNGLLADARNVCVCERVMWTSSSPSLVFIIPRHVPTN
jgi:hypothetical protein